MGTNPGKALSQLRKGVLEYCVLTCLLAGPRYGLEISSQLSPHKALFSSGGTLYPLMSRMRKRGWVDTYWEPSESGPPRRYYTLTTQGIAAAQEFKEVWALFRKDVDTVLEKSDG